MRDSWECHVGKVMRRMERRWLRVVVVRVGVGVGVVGGGGRGGKRVEVEVSLEGGVGIIGTYIKMECIIFQ